jgi:hypothetical protein
VAREWGLARAPWQALQPVAAVRVSPVLALVLVLVLVLVLEVLARVQLVAAASARWLSAVQAKTFYHCP